MHLKPNLPTSGFYQVDIPNVKIYTGALPEAIKNVLQGDVLGQLEVQQVTEKIEPLKTFHLFRHFESNYNIYKKRIQENPYYKKFLVSTDEKEQRELAQILLDDFLQEVKVDYHTPLSENGKKQAEEYGRLYGELFSSSPEMIPDKIMISPYTRTKHTAYAILKNFKGLDMDLEFLLDDNNLTDMRIGTMQGKKVVLALSDEIRERDFGNLYGPWFIRELANSNTWETPLDHIAKEKSYYFTSTNGGESQSMVNQRARLFFNEIVGNDRYKTRLIFTHHLFILAAIKNIFGGSFNTFYNLDSNRKPKNGGMTTLVEVPGEHSSHPTKLRVAGYNFTPEA